MNNFFINISQNLNLKSYKDSSRTDFNGIISNVENHISIKKIKASFSKIIPGNYNFQEVYREDVKRELINLNVKKILN